MGAPEANTALGEKMLAYRRIRISWANGMCCNFDRCFLVTMSLRPLESVMHHRLFRDRKPHHECHFDALLAHELVSGSLIPAHFTGAAMLFNL